SRFYPARLLSRAFLARSPRRSRYYRHTNRAHHTKLVSERALPLSLPLLLYSFFLLCFDFTIVAGCPPRRTPGVSQKLPTIKIFPTDRERYSSLDCAGRATLRSAIAHALIAARCRRRDQKIRPTRRWCNFPMPRRRPISR